jgi:hypothetical protein
VAGSDPEGSANDLKKMVTLTWQQLPGGTALKAAPPKLAREDGLRKLNTPDGKFTEKEKKLAMGPQNLPRCTSTQRAKGC